MAQVLQLDNETIEVVKTSRRGSIGLKVEPDRIALMVPKQFSDLTIESLVANEKEWLLDQIRQHQAEMPKKLLLKSGHELLMFGEKILYKEEHKTPVKSLKVELDGACLTAYMNTSRTLKAPEVTARKKVIQFLTDQLQQYLMEKVSLFAEQIAVSPTQITVRNYKSRWGSCYPDGRIQFNWRLAMAPKAVIDYVIQHELCHLIHPNHSPQYWQLVAEQCPDYEMHKQWLKDNGTALIHF